MATPRPERSTEELTAAASHVAYEIETMLFTAEHLCTGHASPATPPQGKERDVYLESFLLHFRNLRAFLCPSLQGCVSDDDVVASDFLDMREFNDVVDKRVFKKRQQQMNRSLAHLSYSRPEYDRRGKKGWRTAEMCRDMVGAFAGFLQRLPAGRRLWFLGSLSDQAVGAIMEER